MSFIVQSFTCHVTSRGFLLSTEKICVLPPMWYTFFMPLLNYTSNVDVDKTAAEISKCLSSHGAQAVMTEYDSVDQTIKSISFKLNVNGTPITFRLPCDWKPVYELLHKNKKPYRSLDSRLERQKSEWQLQAVRTAWRIVKDWVEAQMALIETTMVKPEQVFLPYAVMKGGHTLSEQVLKGEFLLGDGK